MTTHHMVVNDNKSSDEIIKDGYTFLPKERQTGAYVSYLICAICFEYCRDAKYHTGCKILYCGACLEECISKKMACPTCRNTDLGRQTIVSISVLDQQLFNDLLVTCNRCSAEMRLERFNDHNNKQCTRPCPFGCAERVTLQQFNDSHEAKCINKPIPCTFARLRCPWTGSAQEREKHLNAEAVDSCGYQQLHRLLESVEQMQWRLAMQRRPWIKALHQKIDCQDATDLRWYHSKILQQQSTPTGVSLYITFTDYAAMYNEWIDFDSPRLAPLGTHTHTTTPRTRHSSVNIGTQASTPAAAAAAPSNGPRRVVLFNSTGSTTGINREQESNSATLDIPVLPTIRDTNQIPVNFRFNGMNNDLHSALIEAFNNFPTPQNTHNNMND